MNVPTVCPAATRHRCIHSTRKSHHHHSNVFEQRVEVRLRLHTESITNDTYSSYTNINIRAVRPRRANTTPIRYIQHTKINAEPSSQLLCFGQKNGACMRVTLLGMHYDLILHWTRITNTFKFKHTQQCKRTSCWFRANTTPVVPYIQKTKVNAEPPLPSDSKIAHESETATSYCIDQW